MLRRFDADGHYCCLLIVTLMPFRHAFDASAAGYAMLLRACHAALILLLDIAVFRFAAA